MGARARASGPESDLFTAELIQQVDDALEALDPPHGQVAQLVLLDGLSVDAAAGVLRLSRDETARAMHVVRVHLRGVIDASLR